MATMVMSARVASAAQQDTVGNFTEKPWRPGNFTDRSPEPYRGQVSPPWSARSDGSSMGPLPRWDMSYSPASLRTVDTRASTVDSAGALPPYTRGPKCFQQEVGPMTWGSGSGSMLSSQCGTWDNTDPREHSLRPLQPPATTVPWPGRGAMSAAAGIPGPFNEPVLPTITMKSLVSGADSMSRKIRPPLRVAQPSSPSGSHFRRTVKPRGLLVHAATTTAVATAATAAQETEARPSTSPAVLEQPSAPLASLRQGGTWGRASDAPAEARGRVIDPATAVPSKPFAPACSQDVRDAAERDDWQAHTKKTLAAENHGPALVKACLELSKPRALWVPELWLHAREEALAHGRSTGMKPLFKLVLDHTQLSLDHGYYQLVCRKPLTTDGEGVLLSPQEGRSAENYYRIELGLAEIPRIHWFGRRNVDIGIDEPDLSRVSPPVIICDKAPLEVAREILRMGLGERHLFLGAEVTAFDASGTPDTRRAMSMNPHCLPMRTDIRRFVEDATSQLRAGRSTAEGHMRAERDPYIFICPDVTAFRGSRDEGFQYLDQPFKMHVIMSASSKTRPAVQKIPGKKQVPGLWYTHKADHASLLERLNLIALAALQSSGLRGDEDEEEVQNHNDAPILVLSALGFGNESWHPRDAFASCLKQWRQRFSRYFHSIYVCCSHHDVGNTDLALHVDEVVNKNVYRMADSDLLAARAMPWHWDWRQLGLAVSCAKLEATAQIVRPRGEHHQQQRRLKKEEMPRGTLGQARWKLEKAQAAAAMEGHEVAAGSEKNPMRGQRGTVDPDKYAKQLMEQQSVPSMTTETAQEVMREHWNGVKTGRSSTGTFQSDKESSHSAESSEEEPEIGGSAWSLKVMVAKEEKQQRNVQSGSEMELESAAASMQRARQIRPSNLTLRNSVMAQMSTTSVSNVLLKDHFKQLRTGHRPSSVGIAEEFFHPGKKKPNKQSSKRESQEAAEGEQQSGQADEAVVQQAESEYTMLQQDSEFMAQATTTMATTYSDSSQGGGFPSPVNIAVKTCSTNKFLDYYPVLEDLSVLKGSEPFGLQPTKPSDRRRSASDITGAPSPAGRRRSLTGTSAIEIAKGISEEKGSLVRLDKEAKYIKARETRRTSISECVGGWNASISLGGADSGRGQGSAETGGKRSSILRRASLGGSARRNSQDKDQDGINQETEQEIRRRVREKLMQKPGEAGAVAAAAASAQPNGEADKQMQQRRRNSLSANLPGNLAGSGPRRNSAGAAVGSSSLEEFVRRRSVEGPGGGSVAPSPRASRPESRQSGFSDDSAEMDQTSNAGDKPKVRRASCGNKFDMQMGRELEASLPHRPESDTSSDGMGALYESEIPGAFESGGDEGPLMTQMLSCPARMSPDLPGGGRRHSAGGNGRRKSAGSRRASQGDAEDLPINSREIEVVAQDFQGEVEHIADEFASNLKLAQTRRASFSAASQLRQELGLAGTGRRRSFTADK